VYVEGDEDEAEAETEETAVDTLAALVPIRSSTRSTQPRRTSTATLRRASTASNRGHRAKALDEEQGGHIVGQTKETQEQGKVKWSVYAAYASNANIVAVTVWIVVLVMAQMAQIGKSHPSPLVVPLNLFHRTDGKSSRSICPPFWSIWMKSPLYTIHSITRASVTMNYRIHQG
jgi:hypothetical protein